jgi:tripartite-type tricarboxylate transporter receptor subunit TctC
MHRAGLFAAAAAMLVASTLAAEAVAQSDPAANFPNRPIHLVVGFSAGGGTDIFARMIAPRMFPGSGQPTVIENKPGAGSIIASEYVARAPADGYTILLNPVAVMTVNEAVYPKLPYSTLRDFAPISILSSYPFIMVVTTAVPVSSIKDLVDYVKTNPARANISGASPIYQLTTELFRIVTGARMEYIGYKSSTESVAAVASGEVLATLSDAPPVSNPIRNGQVRGLAVTSRTRMEAFPDLPTMAELGLPKLEMTGGNGALAPAGTPPAVIDKLQKEFIRVIQLPDVRERFSTFAAEPVGSTAQEFGRYLAADIERWTAVARSGNIKVAP